MKTCYTCKISKELTEFGKDNRSSDGVKCQCKKCRRLEYNINHSKILEQKKNDYRKHKEKRLLEMRNRYKNNPNYFKLRRKKYYLENKEKVIGQIADYREKNREVILQKKRDYQQRKRAEKLKQIELFNSQLITVNYPDTYKVCTKCQSLKEIINNFNKKSRKDNEYRDVCKHCQSLYWIEYKNNNSQQLKDKQREIYYRNHGLTLEKKKAKRKTVAHQIWSKNYRGQSHVRIADSCRTRINTAIKLYNLNKTKHSIEYLGCDIDFLIEYLQSKFKEGMTWDNYGEWHIDHILPCCSFDLTKQEEVDKCFHYTNLQPLWAQDNLSKASKDKEISIYC